MSDGLIPVLRPPEQNTHGPSVLHFRPPCPILPSLSIAAAVMSGGRASGLFSCETACGICFMGFGVQHSILRRM